MEIQKGLLELKPREEVGSKTSSKYSFQHDLSLFILLENHDKLDDYVYLFDFHDDLVKLNSSVNPSAIDFFQIKTKKKVIGQLMQYLNPAKQIVIL